MEKLEIVTDKEKLSKPCSPVLSEEEGKRIGELLVEQLKLYSNIAVGLAANQVGIDARVFATLDNSGYHYYVNPEIVSFESPEIFKNEGCLSIPGKNINTFRFTKIVAKDMFNSKIELNNFAAIIFEHEYDHINGILMHEREASIYKPCPCGSGKKFKFCHMR